MSESVPGAPTRFAWLSIAAALVTVALKATAYLLTGSVGLLSDALESLVNLAAATLLLLVLRFASTPEDEGHPFGHGKAEYFSSGVEGALIVVAALAIFATAIPRLLEPAPLTSIGLGLGAGVLASVVNLLVALRLRAAARTHRSIALEADAHHLMTDVWTSAGVIAGVGLVALTGWNALDPLLAMGVAIHILVVGGRLIHRSLRGLLDAALPEAERAELVAVLDRHARESGGAWHALRTRQAGARRFVSVHVLVPGEWTVQRGHDLCEAIEHELAAIRSPTSVFTHLEPVEDERSFADQRLDRHPPT